MSELSVLRTGALAVTVLMLLLLAGCGSVRAGAAAAGSPGASGAPTLWVSYGPGGVQLVSVRASSSGRVLAVAAQVPAGRDGGERDLTASVTDFTPAVADLAITFQSRLAVVVAHAPGG